MDFFHDLEGICDAVWEQASRWKPFDRDSVGIQLVRALDSIGANLAEGDGRYSNKESLQFFSVARASAREARFWLRRASRRNLMPKEEANTYLIRLESVLRRMNALMTARRRMMSEVREEAEGSSYMLQDNDFDTP